MPSITKYGRNPPIKKSKLKKLISESYPIFTPRAGSIASIDGGMQSLIARLSEKLTALDNVQIILNQAVQSPESVADSHGVDLESVIWAAPGFQKNYTESKLSIFAVGYRKNQVNSGIDWLWNAYSR